MNWMQNLFLTSNVPHMILVLGLVIVCGLLLGGVKIKGISVGIAGVLFSGILFGHFKITIEHGVLEFLREFGLILFVYSIGIQVGPG